MLFRSSYLRKYFLVTFFMALFVVAITRLSWFSTYEIFSAAIFIFYAVLSPILFWLASKGIMNKSNQRFVAAISGVMTVKLLLTIIFMIVFVIMMKPADGFFIVPMFVCYMCYTILEVVEMVRLTKKVFPSAK